MVVLDAASESAPDTGAELSSVSFRFRFRTILLETVAPFNPPIELAFVVFGALSQDGNRIVDITDFRDAFRHHASTCLI